MNFDITKYHKCLEPLEWYGCYDGDGIYKQFVTPESYAHPAKASFLLIERILKHLEKLELLKEGMTIADVMAGSGRIPLLASLKGYNSVSVELEPHFIKMIEDNKKKAEKVTGRKLPMQIIQGDSRKLSSLLSNSNVGIFSPPFANDIVRFRPAGNSPMMDSEEFKKKNIHINYTDNLSLNNIGNLPYKDNEIVGVFSPPFSDMNHPTNYLGKQKKESCSEYSDNPQNIGNLKDSPIVGITSPPYVAQSGGHNVKGGHIDEGLLKRSSAGRTGDERYTQTEGNIAQLKDNSIVGITSPPYDNRLSDGGKDGSKWEQWHKLAQIKMQVKHGNQGLYNKNPENLGNQQGENYLSAMLQVYKECAKTMPIIVTITKNPTRNGKLRRLDLDTAKLLEIAGYKIIDYHRAILFKDIAQQTLTGSTKKEYKGRLSFFKRLSLSKGNVASQWEDILIGVRI